MHIRCTACAGTGEAGFTLAQGQLRGGPKCALCLGTGLVKDRWREVLEALRADGWSVAVHNDYRLNGEAHTFWLFTKDGRAVKGEGRTDAEALDAVRAALATPSREPCSHANCPFGGGLISSASPAEGG